MQGGWFGIDREQRAESHGKGIVLASFLALAVEFLFLLVIHPLAKLRPKEIKSIVRVVERMTCLPIGTGKSMVLPFPQKAP